MATNNWQCKNPETQLLHFWSPTTRILIIFSLLQPPPVDSSSKASHEEEEGDEGI